LTEPIIIVGASLGGLRTAEALRRFGYGGAITVIGDEPHLPYNRPPLSKDALAAGLDHASVAFPRRSSTADVNWVLNTRIMSADLDRHLVATATSGTFRYDALVVATGVRPRRLAVRNSGLPGSFALRTLEDAIGLRSVLLPGARVVIAGAGFIGCEVAATARGLGCRVTVVGEKALPMQEPLGDALSAELMRRHEAHGVSFRMRSRVVDVIGADRVSAVRLEDSTELPCDVLVEAIGSLPNTEWLQGNDLNLDRSVLTDSAMRALRRSGVAWPDVFAVGDVARFPNPTYGLEAWSIEHWNIPTETGKRAGEILAARAAGPEVLREIVSRPFAPVPSFWSDQYDVHMLAFGMPGLADRVELLHGDPAGDCVFGYYRGARLVGVCGVGMTSQLRHYRDLLALPAPEVASR
jgi:3-phenylpropionate/trans-cinnamate dioxygenase ferredoxin reductase subunit